jgi:hypothetical protein
MEASWSGHTVDVAGLFLQVIDDAMELERLKSHWKPEGHSGILAGIKTPLQTHARSH